MGSDKVTKALKDTETPVSTVAARTNAQLHRLCRECGSYEFLRRPRTLLHRLFSTCSYRCGKCSYRETRFKIWAGTIILPLFVLGLVAGTTYLVARTMARRGASASLSTADTLDRARVGGLSTFEQMMLRKPKGTMDNAGILQLWRSNVGVDVILQMIRTSNPDYDVGANAVIELKKAGVDERIILAMIDAPYTAR
jgi:hypothetical protein